MDDRQFDRVYAIMQASFPNIERRTYEGQKALLANPHYRLFAESDGEGDAIGFIASWEFADFRFVEHFAVDPAIRGGGVGGRLMSGYLARSPKPVILEVEPPETEPTRRRVGFYERLGFRLNGYDYLQPPLQPGLPDLPLKIMSYPEPLSEPEFSTFRDTLYERVYRVSRDL
ncbi:GNAT family N-acetyltransferase [Cohnella sp. GCM10027633]|uniref:GNAT family N-acetyltransferase n=1 Tax=unclassified Cohnella TaxID=2636738 RepID=UPI00364344EB